MFCDGIGIAQIARMKRARIVIRTLAWAENPAQTKVNPNVAPALAGSGLQVVTSRPGDVPTVQSPNSLFEVRVYKKCWLAASFMAVAALLLSSACSKSAPTSFLIEIGCGDHYQGARFEVAGLRATCSDKNATFELTGTDNAKLPASTPALSGTPVVLQLDTACGVRNIETKLAGPEGDFEKKQRRASFPVAYYISDVPKITRTNVYIDAPTANRVTIGTQILTPPFPRSMEVRDIGCGPLVIAVDDKPATIAVSPVAKANDNYKAPPGDFAPHTTAYLVTDEPRRCFREGWFAYGNGVASNGMLNGSYAYQLSLVEYATIFAPLPSKMSTASGNYGDSLSALIRSACPS